MPEWDRYHVHTDALWRVFSVSNADSADYKVRYANRLWLQRYMNDMLRIALYNHWHTEAELKGVLFYRQIFKICMEIAVLWYKFHASTKL